MKSQVTVRIHAVAPGALKSPGEDDAQEKLIGEIEIDDYIYFEELVIKAIEMFNEQLADKGVRATFLKESRK